MCSKGKGGPITRLTVPYGPFGLVIELSVSKGSEAGPSFDFCEAALEAALAAELVAGESQAAGREPSRALLAQPSAPKAGNNIVVVRY